MSDIDTQAFLATKFKVIPVSAKDGWLEMLLIDAEDCDCRGLVLSIRRDEIPILIDELFDAFRSTQPPERTEVSKPSGPDRPGAAKSAAQTLKGTAWKAPTEAALEVAVAFDEISPALTPDLRKILLSVRFGGLRLNLPVPIDQAAELSTSLATAVTAARAATGTSC